MPKQVLLIISPKSTNKYLILFPLNVLSDFFIILKKLYLFLTFISWVLFLNPEFQHEAKLPTIIRTDSFPHLIV